MALTPRGYPQKTPSSPVFPFFRFGAMSFIPLRLDCGNGGQVSGTVHCFTKAGPGISDPEAQCDIITRRIADVIESIGNIDVSGEQLSVFVTGGQIIMDIEEADCFHGWVDFEATVT
ncbi:MAG: hypothetical protein ACRCVX_12455 [Shewanella sp.]